VRELLRGALSRLIAKPPAASYAPAALPEARLAKNEERVGGAHSLGKAHALGFVGVSISNRKPKTLLPIRHIFILTLY
jgi:hypothetical protein